jgi:hypothetical protein
VLSPADLVRALFPGYVQTETSASIEEEKIPESQSLTNANSTQSDPIPDSQNLTHGQERPDLTLTQDPELEDSPESSNVTEDTSAQEKKKKKKRKKRVIEQVSLFTIGKSNAICGYCGVRFRNSVRSSKVREEERWRLLVDHKIFIPEGMLNIKVQDEMGHRWSFMYVFLQIEDFVFPTSKQEDLMKRS